MLKSVMSITQRVIGRQAALQQHFYHTLHRNPTKTIATTGTTFLCNAQLRANNQQHLLFSTNLLRMAAAAKPPSKPPANVKKPAAATPAKACAAPSAKPCPPQKGGIPAKPTDPKPGTPPAKPAAKAKPKPKSALKGGAQYATMDDMNIPRGVYKEWYTKKNSPYNILLVSGAILLAMEFILTFAGYFSDVMYLNYTVPEYPEEEEEEEEPEEPPKKR